MLIFFGKIMPKGSNILFFFFLIACFLSRTNLQFFFVDILGQLSFQILGVGILLIFVSLILKRFWLSIICIFICILYAADIWLSCDHCNAISKNKLQNYKKIRLMTFNASYYENCKLYYKINSCRYNQFKNFDNFLKLIIYEKPDVIQFQEISPPMHKKIKSLKSIYPFSIGLNRHLDIFDSVIISKYPLKKKIIRDNYIIQTNLIINETELTIIGIHLIKSVTQNELNLSIKRMEYLKTLIENTNQNLILIGDLNMTRASKRFTNFLNDTNLYTYISYKDPTLTWPTFLPNFFGLQLDHVLFSKNLKMIRKKTTNYFGSDHRPLLVELAL